MAANISAAELLNQLNAAGGWIQMVDGKPRLRGAKVSDKLMAALKENRETVLAEMERRRAEDRDRYYKVPQGAPPLLGHDLDLKASERWQLMRYCLQQGRVIQAWVMHRAKEYFDSGTTADDCEWRAWI